MKPRSVLRGSTRRTNHLGPPVHDVRDGVRQRRPDWTIGKVFQCVFCLLRELFASQSSPIDSASIADDGDDVSDELVIRLLGGEELLHTRPAARGETWTGENQR